MSENDDYILIRGKKIPVETKDVPHTQLQFWSDNPRVYSLLDHTSDDPDQTEIFDSLSKTEDFRELRGDIEDNGGLIDPIIVRDSDMVVIEGNRRLAAYRSLASKNSIKWAMIRCRILPKDIDEAAIFAMLGQYHIKGKKDWAPYERAGFVHRRHKHHKEDISDVAIEIGVTPHQVQHLVNVYQFMRDHNDQNRERWSHYDELLKSRAIKNARKDIADFDTKIVRMIKSSSLRAVDIRDQLPVICKTPKILKKFAAGSISFEDAYADAKFAGGDSIELSKIKRFRNWISDPAALDDIVDNNAGVRQKINFELKKIEARIESVRGQLQKVRSN